MGSTAVMRPGEQVVPQPAVGILSSIKQSARESYRPSAPSSRDTSSKDRDASEARFTERGAGAGTSLYAVTEVEPRTSAVVSRVRTVDSAESEHGSTPTKSPIMPNQESAMSLLPGSPVKKVDSSTSLRIYGGENSLAALLKKQVLTSLVASVCAELATYPLETVKLMQQVRGGSAMRIITGLLKSGGLRALYHGTQARLLQTVLSNVGFFLWQAILQEDDATWVRKLLLNMGAQQITRVFTMPLEVVANINQSDPKSGGALRVINRVYREDGICGFWKGLGISLVLSLNPALMFTLVDKLTALLKKFANAESVSAGQMFQISAVAKMIATLLTYPLIRMKTVMQTSKSSGDSAPMMFLKMYQQEGLRGMYQGVWVLSYKTVLFNALLMAVKERVSKAYNEYLRKPLPMGIIQSADSTLPMKPAELPFNVASPDANPQDEGQGSQVEALLAEYPWEARAHGKSVIYVAGAWAFLHPSHQHLLNEAKSRGHHICVGVHDGRTRINNHAKAPEEKFETRLERIRQVKGVHSLVKRAPWEIDEDFINRLGITKVLAGRRCSSDRRDPYFIAEQMGIFEFVEDPYAGMWRRMIKVMFSNIDSSNIGEVPLISSPTNKHAAPKKEMPLFRRDSRGDLRVSGAHKGTLRQTGSWYFLYQLGEDDRPDPSTRRARHLRQTEQRRDRNWSKDCSPDHRRSRDMRLQIETADGQDANSLLDDSNEGGSRSGSAGSKGPAASQEQDDGEKDLTQELVLQLSNQFVEGEKEEDFLQGELHGGNRPRGLSNTISMPNCAISPSSRDVLRSREDQLRRSSQTSTSPAEQSNGAILKASQMSPNSGTPNKGSSPGRSAGGNKHAGTNSGGGGGPPEALQAKQSSY
ncbi:unnamed protein product [Amoebophrya sp. A120]|nr:unnamed protein product [Amoebophrya sp. A120]|eukprot:GSA120T00002038001.1